MAIRRTTTVFTMLAIASALSACSDPVGDAERRFDRINRSSASAAEICAAGQAVVDAHLDHGDAAAYREARVRNDILCSTARGNEAYGFLREANGNTFMPPPADDLNLPVEDVGNAAP
ncbi:hypothetical protein [Sphingomonas oligophenolica]|uniref:hypothetical protein n=1 Tax=Sphingomonas oligophenolica TaxID=301154 RepID=UPI00112B85CB|nr:hypothetical protein [Sphingomonas oligophenolica]